MKTIILLSALLMGCTNQPKMTTIQSCNELDSLWDAHSSEFTHCLDSLGGTDTDCIDCQMLVYGSIIDSTYLF